MTEIITRDAEATVALGEALAAVVAPNDVVLLSGELGAGKTVLAKGIARGLGVSEEVTSPTFNILLVHEGRIALNHIDLYRLERVGELEDIDYRGTLESGGVSVVEWGDRFAEAVPENHLTVRIGILDDEVRFFELLPGGDRGRQLAGDWLERSRSLEGVEIGEDAS